MTIRYRNAFRHPLNKIANHFIKKELLRQKKIRQSQWPDLMALRDKINRSPPSNLPITITQEHFEHCTGEWISPLVTSNAMSLNCFILFLHGGGYALGSLASYRSFCSRIAHMTQYPLLNVDYRLAPEHPYPAALNDAVDTYKILRLRYPHARIILMGDSAGGGLALASLLSLQEAQCALPELLILLSPWADLTLTSPSHKKNLENDALFIPEDFQIMANHYCQANAPHFPLISPALAPLKHYPPTLILASPDEMLLDDSLKIYHAAQHTGQTCQLDLWPQMVHVWPLYATLPAANEALLDIKRFINHHLS